MDSKCILDMDSLKISDNKKIMKCLDVGQYVILSATVIKINHVNKRQERALVVTNKNIINIAAPSSFLPNRIKRKIPLYKITGITTGRFGNEVVVHIDSEDDYRFFSTNLKKLYIETVVVAIGKATHKPVKIYWYDDLTLHQYTTTIIDLKNQTRKPHKVEPMIVDEKYLKKNLLVKPQSKLIFKKTDSQFIQSFQQFDIIKVLGRGAYGKVMLCKHMNSGKYYAVKSMRKDNLIQNDSIQRAKTERLLLQKINHPFLVSLEYAFQTKQKIFLVMKFYRGGELFSRLRKQKKFSQQRAKFYAAQVLLAIQHLHSLGFVYRDLKPQNILFDTNGYIKVSDYGLAKELKKGELTYSMTGTPSYLSPQILKNEGHNFMVDWWSLGILIYEMVFGGSPFYCKDQREMFGRIIHKQLQLPKDCKISEQCCHLLKSLLYKHPQKRLGEKGPQQIRNHPWFKDIDWNAILQKKITPDYIPSVLSDEDVSHFFDQYTKEQPVDTVVRCDHAVLKKYQRQFWGFEYNRLERQQQQYKRFTVMQSSSKQTTTTKQQSSISEPTFGKTKI